MRIKFAIVVCLYSFTFQAFSLPGCELPRKWQSSTENPELSVLTLGGDQLSTEVPEGDCTIIMPTAHEEAMANQPLGLFLGLGTRPNLCAEAAERKGFRCFQTARTNHSFNAKNGSTASVIPTTDCFACR